MNKASDILRLGKQILKDAGCESYGFDASCIFEYCYGFSRAELFLDPDRQLDEGRFLSLCKKRAGGYPLQYILNSWQFMGLDLYVDARVLIPRADTETLAEYIISRGGRPRILDMCTGSGCIGIALSHYMDGARVTLADISEDALEVAAKNAKACGADVDIVRADLLDGYEKYFERGAFDIIVSNPPYIKSGDRGTLSPEVLCEPHIALFGGDDGLTFYSALIEKWKGAISPDGIMVLESGYDTWQDIGSLFEKAGYTDVEYKKDVGGITRLVCAKNGK